MADTPTPTPQEMATELEQYLDDLVGGGLFGRQHQRRDCAVVVMEQARVRRILSALRAAQEREAALRQQITVLEDDLACALIGEDYDRLRMRAEAAERERDALADTLAALIVDYEQYCGCGMTAYTEPDVLRSARQVLAEYSARNNPEHPTRNT